MRWLLAAAAAAAAAAVQQAWTQQEWQRHGRSTTRHGNNSGKVAAGSEGSAAGAEGSSATDAALEDPARGRALPRPSRAPSTGGRSPRGLFGASDSSFLVP